MEDAARLRSARVALGGIACALAISVAHADAPRFAATARALLADAHAQAAADRHGRAVTCALAAIRLDPSLEPDAALLLANQLTWSDRPAEAIPWYEEHLEHFPGDCEGSLGLARALSWTDRLEEAAEIYRALGEDCTGSEAPLGVARMEAWKGNRRAAADRYRDVLGDDPGSREAARGLGDAENLRGRHRRAEEIFRDLLDEEPDDERARIGLARAQYWQGRHDLALATLADADGADADALRGVVRDEGRLRVDARGSAYTDVDDQDLESLVFAARKGWHPQSGGRLEVVHATTREPGSPELTALRLLGGGWWRPTASWALHAYAGALFPRADADIPAGEGEVLAPADVEKTRSLWDTWVTWTPADWTRFDLGWARIPIETPKSLARGIRIDLLALSAERRLIDELILRGRASLGDYTDGNRRTAFLAEAEWGPLPVGAWAALHTGGGFSSLSFDEQVDRGYYSPERYDAFWGLVRIDARLGRFRLDASSRIGSEREGDQERFGVWSNSGEIRFLGNGFDLGVFAQNSTSRFDTSAGYGRKGWGILVALSP